MTRIRNIDVSEQQLEDLVRQHVDQIEEGLRYVSRQRFTATGRLDVLFVDSGHSLVVAELKIIEDGAVLFQAIDYYDYVSVNLEAFARLYSSFLSIQPKGAATDGTGRCRAKCGELAASRVIHCRPWAG